MLATSELGVASVELGWVPSPTYLLRRAAILERLGAWPAGRVLEVGCGGGTLLFDLAGLGYSGVGVEVSSRGRELAAQFLADQPAMAVQEQLPSRETQFDYLLSFEVLEHVEKDAQALSDWVARLKPGGRCLISVPAHRDRWNVTDVLAGHFRRYERDEVTQLVEGAGLRVDSVETYGWPATWLIERVRCLVRELQLRARGVDPASIQRGDPERTRASGVERSTESYIFPVYSSWLGRKALRAAVAVQRRYYESDRGISYLVTATK